MKLGIIGNGASAHSFAGASHLADGVELVAVAGRNLERVTSLTDKYGGQPMTIDQLQNADIDCVAVSTPPGLHLDHALPFLRAGVHAMVEKPLALCVEHCDRMIETAATAGAKLMATQTHRYTAYGRKAYEIATGDKYGKVTAVQAYVAHDYFTNKRSGWQLDVDLGGGGVVFNPFIHAIDLVRYLAGSDPETVTGHLGYHKPGYDIDGDVTCFVVLQNGVPAMVRVDGYGHYPDTTVDVTMEEAVMLVRPLAKRIEVRIRNRVAEVFGFGENGVTNDKGIYGHCGYINHLTEMQAVIEKNAPLTSDGENGRANVAIARQILEMCGAPLPGAGGVSGQ